MTKYYAIGGEGYGGSGFWASGGGGGYSIVSKRTNYGPQGRNINISDDDDDDNNYNYNYYNNNSDVIFI